MKTIIAAIAFVASASLSATAYAALPVCGDGDYLMPSLDQGPADKREFALPPLIYTAVSQTPPAYGFDVSLVVDESGRVTCATPPKAGWIEAPQRKALMDAIEGWHYKPFLINGKATRVVISEHIDEELRLAHRVPMPIAPLSQVSIQWSDGRYTATMHGDGSASFTGIHYRTGRKFRHAYRIDRRAFAMLVKHLRAADAWSLMPQYIGELSDRTDPKWLTIKVGKQVKTVKFDNPELTGLPVAMRPIPSELDDVARFYEQIPSPHIPLPSIPLEY